MKTKSLLFLLLGFCGMVSAQRVETYYTTTGSCADYLRANDWDKHFSDSIYTARKLDASQTIVIDGEDNDAAWSAFGVLADTVNLLANEAKDGQGAVMDLSVFPQSEADLFPTFRAVWTDNGVYFFLKVKDDLVRYQNYDYQWENDGIEFMFAPTPGAPLTQIIIPAMVGTRQVGDAASTFETGVQAATSDARFKVLNADPDWDASVFNWAVKKTADGYNVEAYMDKDIVTKQTSGDNFGIGKMFAMDIQVDEADETQNTNDPALYVRECAVQMLSNFNQGYGQSQKYGYFAFSDKTTSVKQINNAVKVSVYPNPVVNVLNFKNSSNIAKVTIQNVVGQTLISENLRGASSVNVASLNAGVYFVTVLDAQNNVLASQKIVKK